MIGIGRLSQAAVPCSLATRAVACQRHLTGRFAQPPETLRFETAGRLPLIVDRPGSAKAERRQQMPRSYPYVQQESVGSADGVARVPLLRRTRLPRRRFLRLLLCMMGF